MNRLTETDKWKDPWFRSLSAPAKLIFFYIVDNCDHAGFWEFDLEYLSFTTKIKAQFIEGSLKELQRSIIGPFGGWYWAKNFIRHQKNEPLNPSNPFHKRILSSLRTQAERFKGCAEFKNYVAPLKGHNMPLIRVDKSIVKKEESAERRKQAEEIYEAYPRKVGKPDAIRAILKAIDRGTTPDRLLESTKSYAMVRSRGNNGFIPNPSTWFNQDRFADDPKTWEDQNPKDKKPKEEEMRIV